ncbi:MAG: WD40/YVTN/BNR-like repeat-containing protein, partial [Terriglobales bacterium]
SNSQVIYAAMWQMTRRHWTFSSGGPGSGLYKTTDGGATWANISHRPGLPTGIFGKIGVAVAPSDPSVVYALIQADYKGQAGGLFRSDDSGETWKLVNNDMNITQRAFYYGRVYVDPKDPNTIYLPNVGFFMSRNGGKKIEPLGDDNHAIWINPDNTQIMIKGDDQGAAVSRDGGKIWSSETNQPTGQFYHVNFDDQFPFHIYGAQQDRGSDEGSSAAPAAVWTGVRGGEMSWVVPTPGRPWITYGSGYYSDYYKENRRTGVTTNVSPWPAYKFGLAGSKIQYRYGWIHHAAAFAPGSPNELLYGANVLFETLDGGANWKIISPDLTRNDKSKQGRPGGPISADVTGEEMFDTISSIAFSPSSDSVIWVGSDDGLVHVTTDGGATWSGVRPPQLPTWSTITCIEPSHTDQGTAYVSASRYDWDDFQPYVYKTTDYGKTWTAITNGLPQDEYVESVRQDPNDPDLMFAATSATVYFSLDGGQQWQPLKLNLPAVRVSDIEIQPQQHAVVISTFGRAFWVLDDLQFLEQLANAHVTSDAAYLFQPQQGWMTLGGRGFGFGGGAHGQNLAPGITVFFYLPSSYTSGTPVKLTFTNANGGRVNSYMLPLKAQRRSGGGFGFRAAPRAAKLHPGMNRFQWNMRYPNAVDVTGIFNSGFAANVPVGPEVVPGTYDVTLSYDGNTPKQSFVVKLDPQFHTTQAQLVERFNLLMRIHDALTQLDTNLNQAISVRKKLEAAGDSAAQAQAVNDLNRDINAYVDLKIRSGEGGLVYPGRLRAWLTSIAGQISMDLAPMTPQMIQVAHGYIQQAGAAVTRLRAGVAAASQALNR